MKQFVLWLFEIDIAMNDQCSWGIRMLQLGKDEVP